MKRDEIKNNRRKNERLDEHPWLWNYTPALTVPPLPVFRIFTRPWSYSHRFFVENLHDCTKALLFAWIYYITAVSLTLFHGDMVGRPHVGNIFDHSFPFFPLGSRFFSLTHNFSSAFLFLALWPLPFLSRFHNFTFARTFEPSDLSFYFFANNLTTYIAHGKLPSLPVIIHPPPILTSTWCIFLSSRSRHCVLSTRASHPTPSLSPHPMRSSMSKPTPTLWRGRKSFYGKISCRRLIMLCKFDTRQWLSHFWKGWTLSCMYTKGTTVIDVCRWRWQHV